MYPGVLIKYLRLIIEAFFNIEKYDYFFNDMQLVNLMFPRIFIENYIVLFTVKMVSLNIHRIKQLKKQIKNHIKCFNKKKPASLPCDKLVRFLPFSANQNFETKPSENLYIARALYSLHIAHQSLIGWLYLLLCKG